MLFRNKVAIVVVGSGVALVTAYQTATSDAVVSRTLRREIANIVGAPVAFDSASFSFLHGLQVKNLSVLDPADPLGPPVLAAEHAHVNYVLDVFGAGPHVTRIEVEKPRVHLARASDGTFPALRAFNIPPPEGPSSPKPYVHLADGEVTYADPTLLHAPLSLSGIDIEVKPAPKATTWAHAAVRLKAASDVLGAIEAHVDVDDSGNAAEIKLDLASTRINPSLPGLFVGALGRRIGEFAPEGELSAQVKARLAEGKQIVVEIPVELRGVSLTASLPETHEGEPAPQPVKVTELSGHLRFADDRIETHDLAFKALGAEVRVDAKVFGVTQPAPSFDAKVRIAGLHVTPELRAHVPYVARRVLEAYDLTGSLDATVNATGLLSDPRVTADATVTGGHVRYYGYLHPDGKRYGFPWAGEDVHGKVKFDGTTLHIDAKGRHGPATAEVQVRIEFPKDGPVMPDVSILVHEVPLDDELRNSFADGGEEVFGKWGPSGVAKSVGVHVWRRPEIDPDHDLIEVTVECDGRAGFLPRILRTPLTEATGKVEILEPVVDGHHAKLVKLTNVAAKADGFTMSVSGEVRDDGPKHTEDLVVTVDTADAGGGLRTAALGAEDGTISPGVKDAIRKLGPSGPAGIVAHLVTHADGKHDDSVTISLRGSSVTGWDDIPLAARGLTGRAVVANDVLTLEDVAGFLVVGDSLPWFTAAGRLIGLSKEPQFDVHVESPQVPLGDSLRAALGPLAEKARAFWEEVAPKGGARAAVVLDLRPESDPTPFEVRLSSIHGTIAPQGMELDCDDGSFHYDGRRAEIHGLAAALGNASVRVDEAIVEESGRVTIRAVLRNLRFPEDLEGPLGPDAIAKIVEIAPGRVVHAPDIVVVYEPEARTLEVAGLLRFSPRSRRPLRDPGLSLEGFLDVNRLVFYMPEDRPAYFQGEARTGAGNDPGISFRAGLAIDRFKGPIEISGTFGEKPEFDLRTTGATFRLQGFPLTQAEAKARMRIRGVHVDLTANYMDGVLQGWCGPGRDGVSYQGECTLVGADLERAIRERSGGEGTVSTGKLDGKARFQVHEGPRGGLRGDGSLHAYDARLMESPGISAVARVATVGLYTPVLTEGTLKFDFDADGLDVRDLTVTGPGVNGAIDGARGRIGFDGQINLVVNAYFGLGIPGVDQALHVMQLALPSWSVTGTLRNPNTPVPYRLAGAKPLKKEPQPAGDLAAPAHDPW